MELRFDVKGNNFAALRAQADETVRAFIGTEALMETARQYGEVEGISIDASTGGGYRMLNGGFYANVRSTIA